jgi:hypothetical protein
LRWIRRQFGFEPVRQPPGTLEGSTELATLYRVASTESGVCCCYWICHRYADADLVISLISIAQLREDLALQHPYRRKSDPIRFTGHSSFRKELETFLETQGGLDSRFISHIFIAVWRNRIPTTSTVNERRVQHYLVHPMGAFPVDFQSVSVAWSSGNRYAIKITEAIAHKLLRINHDSLVSWQERVTNLEWLELLDYCAKKVFGKEHVLQPRKGLK